MTADRPATGPDHDCVMPSACGVTGFYCYNSRATGEDAAPPDLAREALEWIAERADQRPDGTYNYDRDALRQKARDALDRIHASVLPSGRECSRVAAQGAAAPTPGHIEGCNCVNCEDGPFFTRLAAQGAAAPTHSRTYSLVGGGLDMFLVTDDESGLNIGYARKIGGPLTRAAQGAAAPPDPDALLLRYGRHEEDCPDYAVDPPWHSCTCGWAEVVGASRPATTAEIRAIEARRLSGAPTDSTEERG